MRSALPVDILTDHPRLSSLAILQPIVFCTLFYLALLQATIRSDLYGDTANDYLLCSTLSRATITDYLLCTTLSGGATSDYPIYRLSALPIIRYVGVLPFLLGICLSYFLQLYGLGVDSIRIVWKLN
jgi:hypothetical protein